MAAPPVPPTPPAPPRDARDRASQRRRLGLLKRAALAAAVFAFGGGAVLVGRNAIGVTAQTASASTGGGITTGTSGGVPGLGRPDAQGYFTFQSGFSGTGASASSGSTYRPSIRSRRS